MVTATDIFKNKIFKLVVIATAVLSLTLLYYFFDARTQKSIFPPCLFRTLTPFYCPGCGSQRAISALLHADIVSALHNNLLVVVFLPLLLYAAFIFVWNSFTTRGIQQRIFSSPYFSKLVLITIIIFFLLRNIPSYPFTLLAPR